MTKNFLLRFQEEVLPALATAESGKETTTRQQGEQPDRTQATESCTVLPNASSLTKTSIGGEQQDRRADACAILPNQPSALNAQDTLTYTYVAAEEPRRDVPRPVALVLPACS